MDVSPLALVMILAYGLLLAFCLTAWSFLSPVRERERTRAQASEPAAEREKDSRQRKASNDGVRRARLSQDVVVAQPRDSTDGSESRPPAPARERNEEEDAFERFIRAGRDDFR